MPEATVNEHNRLPLLKNNIRFSRQVLPVNPKATAETVENPSHNQFRRRILTPNAPHDLLSAVLAEVVHGSCLRHFSERSLS